MGFKSTHCTSQDINWGTCSSSLLWIYLRQSLLVCFWSLPWYKTSTNKLRSRWDNMMLQYVVIASLIQFVLHLVQISEFAIGKSPPHHNWASSMLYSRCDTVGYSSFTTHRPSYLTQRFWTLICLSKGLYSIALLSSLCAPWYTEAFWHHFASSTEVSWQWFCHIYKLHRVYSSLWMMTHFFTILVQSCDVWSSQPSVMQVGDSNEIVLCSCFFWSTSPTFGLVLSHFLIFPNSIIHCSSCSVLKQKNTFKLIFQKIFGYTKVRVT